MNPIFGKPSVATGGGGGTIDDNLGTLTIPADALGKVHFRKVHHES